MEAFIACSLMPVNKNSGLRPISVGELLRCTAGKVAMNTLTLSWQRSPADQWTGFYMLGISVMEELKKDVIYFLKYQGYNFTI